MRKLFLGAGLITCLFLASCTNATSKDEQTSSPIYVMGTTITVKFYGVENYETHYQAVKKIYQDIDAVADDFACSSDITNVYVLNNLREGNVPDSLYDLLLKADEIYKDTDGYFNPYMGSLTHLWKTSILNKILPSDLDVKKCLEESQATSLVFGDDNYIKIEGDGNIDLGGIAKGYATGLAEEYLKGQGITSYMIDAGNSSILLGDKNGSDFSCGLTKPFDFGYIGIYKGKYMGISSSSPKYQYMELDGVKYHHLINPKTGYPSNTYDATFVFGDVTSGDAYSTALFSMSMDDAISFSKAHDVSILLYKDNEIIYKSDGISL